jgi:hypothetical protein
MANKLEENAWEDFRKLKNSEQWKLKQKLRAMEIEAAENPYRKEQLEMEQERIKIQIAEGQ